LQLYSLYQFVEMGALGRVDFVVSGTVDLAVLRSR
jgi:hypothetical protein